MNRLTLKRLASAHTTVLLALLALTLSACDSAPAPTPQSTASLKPGAGTANSSPTMASTDVQRTPLATTAEASPTQGATPPSTSGTAGTAGNTQPTETPVASNEQPVAPEQNPVGDIPDSQAFVTYTSPTGGYTLQVPEGWARTENGTDVSFADKLDGVKVLITAAAIAPTSKTAPGNEVATLQKSGRAVQITSVKDVQLPSGPAVLLEYTSNSDPNPVTGKQVRLEDNSYLFFKSGKLAALTLWAPLGADNVDQWQQMAKSFTWK